MEQAVNTMSGQVALVTGASKGLGASIALKLAEKGAAVAVNYHSDEAGATAIVARIREKGGIAEKFGYDVTDETAVAACYRSVTSTLGAPGILVLNATGPQPFIPLEAQRWQDYLDQLVFFVKSPLLMVKQALPDMKSRKMGRIIHIGSEVTDLGNPEFAHYVAAKSAMLGLTRSWAKELGPHRITVNYVAPGWIPVERHRGTPPAELEAYAAGVALDRKGVPEDIAEMVAFLAGEGGAFITGQKIAVNGGNTFN